MEDLDTFLDGAVLTEQAVLERVDEYALYCFYLGYAPEIGRPIISPIRGPGDPDTVGSFVIFYPTYPGTKKTTPWEFLWKDMGTSQSSNIFVMISLIHGGINRSQVLRLIDNDFELGFSSGRPICHRIEPPKKPIVYQQCDIKVRSRDMRAQDLVYWGQYGIDKLTLSAYNVTSVEMFWTYKSQKHPITPGGLCFAYRIWSKYKIYRPFADRDRKFRNDFTPKHIEGFCQLDYTKDDLIITKSMKDVMMFRSNYNIEAIAAHSENTPLPPQAIEYFRAKYKRIFVWYDNDGKESSEKYYPDDFQRVYNPAGPKDPTDYYAKFGREQTAKLITGLTSIQFDDEGDGQGKSSCC